MIISLVSDFGSSSNYLAMAELSIRKHIPDAELVHWARDITPLSILESAYYIKTGIDFFPKNSFHLILSDIIMSFPTQIMVAKINGNYYLGVDNGILTAAHPENEAEFHVTKSFAGNYQEFLSKSCEAILSLNEKDIEANELFQTYHPQVYYKFPQINLMNDGNTIEIMVIYIDSYGNIVTNLKKDIFEHIAGDRPYQINLTRNEILHKIYNHFSEADSGGIVAYFNEFGFMQIAMSSRGGAHSSSLLGLYVFEDNSYINSFIKIEFQT